MKESHWRYVVEKPQSGMLGDGMLGVNGLGFDSDCLDPAISRQMWWQIWGGHETYQASAPLVTGLWFSRCTDFNLWIVCNSEWASGWHPENAHCSFGELITKLLVNSNKCTGPTVQVRRAENATQSALNSYPWSLTQASTWTIDGNVPGLVGCKLMLWCSCRVILACRP